MVDVTHITLNPTTASARLQAQGLLMQELSIAKRTYGGFANALGTAKKLGYVIRPVVAADDVHTTTESMMNGLVGLVPYQSNIDSGWIAGLSSIDANKLALKLFNIMPDQAEMVAGSSGGGTVVKAAGKPALDLSAGQGRGMAASLNPDDFDVYANGRAIVWVGQIDAAPSGTGQIFRIISGSLTYMSFGVVPSGSAYRIIANRRIGSGGSLQQVTVDGGVLALGVPLQVVVLFDVVAGRITLKVNGATIIDNAAWGDGEGLLDATSVTAQVAVPGASNTQKVQHRAAALLNTKDPAIADAVLAGLVATTL